MANRNQARQGDVFIERIDGDLPPGAKPLKLDGGRVVLAYGEVTGHAHALTPTSKSTVLFDVGDGDRVLEVGSDAMRHDFQEYSYKNGNGQKLTGFLDLCCERGLKIQGMVPVREFTTPAEVLTHEEHGIIPLLPGRHDVKIQREYFPEAIRRVVD